MSARKCTDLNYINFLCAAPNIVSSVEAARAHTDVAHDSFTRLLHRLPATSDALWEEAQTLVNISKGFLILDDTVLDKPYAKNMDLVSYHWSGNHHSVVPGINVVSLLWRYKNLLVPVDFRVYNLKHDNKTKNDHFQDMLSVAHQRGFMPEYVLFDSWYSSLGNLKLIRDFHWSWLTQLKSNRCVDPGRIGNYPVHAVIDTAAGKVVHLKGYGMVKVFRTVAKNGDVEFWSTNTLTMHAKTRKRLAALRWGIETYHRGLKQFCGIDRAQFRKAHPQIVHISLSLRSFLRFENARATTAETWFSLKMRVIRASISAYCASPEYLLTMGTA